MSRPTRRLIALSALLLAMPGAIPAACGAGAAYVCPPRGTILFPGITGPALQDSLRLRYRPPTTWNYATARDTMYARIDNHDGTVTCLYTGFTIMVDPNSSQPRTDAFNAGINAEHTWPQSKGAERLPAEADLHHLFPSEINANAVRANFPFAEIPDEQTDRWFRQKTVASAAPDPAVRDDYSEFDQSFPGTSYAGRWEPRELMKGNVARAQFYFYTVYRSEVLAADPGFFEVEKASLREWAHVDPVDDGEYERSCAIAPHQGDRVNPFVIDPTLVDRAYFPETPVTLAYFTAQPGRAVVRVAWETTAEVNHAGFNLLRAEYGVETRLNGALLRGGPRHEFLDRTGRAGAVYDYILEAVGRDGRVERTGTLSARFPDGASAPPAMALGPNPLRAGQILRLVGADPPPTSAMLYDLAGRRVHDFRDPADIVAGWSGRLDSGAALAPGLYFLRARIAGRDVTFRQVVLP